MSLNNEDYKDVKRELGQKMAKRVSHVTKDYTGPKYPAGYDKDSVPNAIKRGNEARKNIEKYYATNSHSNKTGFHEKNSVAKKHNDAMNKAIHAKKEYTGHYQEDAVGKIRHQSSKQVKDKKLGQY